MSALESLRKYTLDLKAIVTLVGKYKQQALETEIILPHGIRATT